MSDTERDPQMSRYLTQSAVPDHAPEFWDALDKQLDTIDHGNPKPLRGETRVVAPIEERQRNQAEVVRLAERPGPPWRRGVALAAAAAVVVFGINFALQGDNGRRVVTDAPAVSTTTFPTAVTGESEAIAAAQRFIAALGVGNIAEARAELGPRSEAYVTAIAGSVDGFLREAEEGYGSLDGLREREVWALRTGANDYVVIIKGVNPVANPELRVEALPVAKSASTGAWLVEPWALDPDGESRIELFQPDPTAAPPVLEQGQPVRVSVPQPGRALFGIDRAALANVGDGASRDLAWTPGDVATGSRVLIIVYKTDRIFTTLARSVEVRS